MTRIWPLPCEGLGNNSYLAEVGSGLALAVDPRPRGPGCRSAMRSCATARTWT
jgi:hypothetical protein